MKNVWTAPIAILAISISYPVTADLNTLNITFSPDSETFYTGETIAFSVSSDGSETQYRYVLERVSENDIIRVENSRWSFDTSYQLDTSALNLEEGNYRLRVISREKANKDEVLVKFNTFTLNGYQPTPCEAFEEGTYTNINASPLNQSYSLTEAMNIISSGLLLTTDENAHNINQINFSEGQVHVFPAEPMTADVNFYGTHQINFPQPLSGSYSCQGGTISINASGQANSAGGAIDFGDLTTTIEGNLSIDGATGSLYNGTVFFD
jgi:hypothetical protein